MMAAAPFSDDGERERLLVVGSPRRVDPAWLARLRQRQPDLSIAQVDTYLAGIADLCLRPANTVDVAVEPGHRRLSDAVAGLRQAAGGSARLVLCCTPETEPLARHVAESGADDYALWPIGDAETDALLGRERPAEVPAQQEPMASMAELAELSALLSTPHGKPRALLERAALLVRKAVDAPGAMIVVEGAAATSGEPVKRPVLTAALSGDNGVRGQLAINERPQRPYTPGEAQKLSHYAQLLGAVLSMASSQRYWRRLALTDECSGLPNRRGLHARLDAILSRASAERFPVTVLFFDLDDFKTYNDRFGHAAGDEIIRAIGQLFRRHCREQDIIARYGGDEFAVVFWDPEGPRAPGSRHPDCALTVLERFRSALQAERFPALGAAAQGSLTISGGLATFPWDATTPNALIQRADEALLAAKRAGKNRVLLIGQTP